MYHDGRYDIYGKPTVNCLFGGQCRDLELVPSLASRSEIAGVYFSQTSVICFYGGFSYCPFYRGVRYSPVGEGVLRISSDRDDRRIFGDLNFLILGLFWVGKFWQVLKILTLFQTKNAIFQTHFQAWFLRKNVIIT